MVLKYFQSKLLTSIYEHHKNNSKCVLVIYEDTKGKTKYKLCKNSTDKEFTYNGFNYYIMSIQQFYFNGFYSNSTIEKRYYSFKKEKTKIDFLQLVEKLLKLFD